MALALIPMITSDLAGGDGRGTSPNAIAAVDGALGAPPCLGHVRRLHGGQRGVHCQPASSTRR